MQEDDRELIPEDEMQDAYHALSDCIGQMDYDAVEMILGELEAYRLPEQDAEKIGKLRELLKRFDWDGMEALIIQE